MFVSSARGPCGAALSLITAKIEGQLAQRRDTTRAIMHVLCAFARALTSLVQVQYARVGPLEPLT